MFPDNILKLIKNSVLYNHTLNLTNAFLTLLTLPLTSSCTVILFDVTDFINLFFFLSLSSFFSSCFFSYTFTVKTVAAAAGGNNYI